MNRNNKICGLNFFISHGRSSVRFILLEISNGTCILDVGDDAGLYGGHLFYD